MLQCAPQMLVLRHFLWLRSLSSSWPRRRAALPPRWQPTWFCPPNSPLIGRSVRPSSSARTSALIVERTCSSGLHKRGCIAHHKACSASLCVLQLSQPIANFRSFTAAEKRSVLLLGALKTTPYPQPLNWHIDENFQFAGTSTISC